MDKHLEFQARKHDEASAYILNLLFGVFGAHRLYLNKGGGVAMLVASLFIVPILVTGVIALVDIFQIRKWVQEVNLALAKELSE